MGGDRMIRVQRSVPSGEARPDDGWLVRMGDKTTLEVTEPGRVTLELHAGWSESGIAYCRLSFKPIRRGLTRFGRRS
jgi:hypothetical protein